MPPSPRRSKKSAEAAEFYVAPAAMEPLLPASQRPKLAELTCEIYRQSGRLAGEIASPVTGQAIAGLIAEMNSYYSNLIEGHKTLPRDIVESSQRRILRECRRPQQPASQQGSYPDRGGNDGIPGQVRHQYPLRRVPLLAPPAVREHRDRLARLLKAAVIEGEIARGKVPEIVCAGPTVARAVIQLALREELLVSQGPKMPLQITFPVKVLEWYFPQLCLDLPVTP